MKRNLLLALLTVLVSGMIATPRGANAVDQPLECLVRGTCYVVEKDDTLWSVDQRYGGFGWREIAAYNHLVNETLHVGQVLYIPPTRPTPIEWFNQERLDHLFDSGIEGDIGIAIAPTGAVYNITKLGYLTFPNDNYWSDNQWYNDRYAKGERPGNISLGTEACVNFVPMGFVFCNGRLWITPLAEFSVDGNLPILHYMPSSARRAIVPVEPPAPDRLVKITEKGPTTGYFDRKSLRIYEFGFDYEWALPHSRDSVSITIRGAAVYQLELRSEPIPANFSQLVSDVDTPWQVWVHPVV